MTASGKKAEARVGGFSSGASPSVRGAVAGGATLNDINNNLRLLVHAVRRLAKAVSVTVSALFALRRMANVSSPASPSAPGLRVLGGIGGVRR
jgi:hypothetical protein